MSEPQSRAKAIHITAKAEFEARVSKVIIDVMEHRNFEVAKIEEVLAEHDPIGVRSFVRKALEASSTAKIDSALTAEQTGDKKE